MEIDLSTLEVGDSVELRNKKIIKITKFNIDNGGTYPYMLNDSFYMKNGKYFENDEFPDDIIKIIKKEKSMEYKDEEIDINDAKILKKSNISFIGTTGDNFFTKECGCKIYQNTKFNKFCDEHSIKNTNNYEPQTEDKVLKITTNQTPLKPEDLKVGMVFMSTESKNVYRLIMKIVKNRVFYHQFRDNENIYNQNSGHDYTIENFICSSELIDKVPPKIVEVEEEIPIYIENTDYKKLKENDYCCVSVNNFSTSSNKIELCKIKRTVKKELEFNWDEGVWK